MVETDQILAQMEEGTKLLSRQFEILQTLGKGAFSKVKLARWITKDTLVAIKVHKDIEKVDAESLKREIEVLASVQHRNIIKLYSCQPQSLIEKKVGSNWEPHRTVYCTVVLELASGCELQQYIEVEKSFGESVSKFIFKEFMTGLSFLHENDIAHRDLKPANILFDQEHTLKIADFGFVAQEQFSRDGLFQTYLGTPQYMAPEIHMIPALKDEAEVTEADLKYEAKPVDIFSAGVILFVTHVGFFPFMTAEMRDPIFSTMVNEGWAKIWELFEVKTKKSYTQDFKELIQGMLDPDPQARWNANQIMESKWLQNGAATEKQAITELERRKFIIDENKAAARKQKEIKALHRANVPQEYKRALTDSHFKFDEEAQELLKHLKKKHFKERVQNEQNCFYLYSPVHPAEFAEHIETQNLNLGEGQEEFEAKRLGHFHYEVSFKINVSEPANGEKDLLKYLDQLEFKERKQHEIEEFEFRQQKIDLDLKVYDRISKSENKYLVECVVRQQISRYAANQAKSSLSWLLEFDI